MRVEQIDQVTVNVQNLETSMKVFRDLLGLQFLPPREITVENQRLRFGWTSFGLGLVESERSETPGFRAVGLRVDDLAAVKEVMTRNGFLPALEVEREGFREAHYVVGDVRFSIAQYAAYPVRLGSVLALAARR